MDVHFIFDLGGTLIFDPFDATLARLSELPLRAVLEGGLAPSAVDPFLDRWRAENISFNFPFASHFLQEEVFIARAAWDAYSTGLIVSRSHFPIWSAEVLTLYRKTAFDIIGSQPHLANLHRALIAARKKGYSLSVASNDRYGATAALLGAAGILEFFDLIATSEGLSFKTPGAEKPTRSFFDALRHEAGLDFATRPTFYIGDDETRDILSTKGMPMRNVRFLGNPAQSSSWVDNPSTTVADFQFADYREFLEMISSGAFEISKN